MTVDRAAKRPVVIFSSQGGMEIEEVAKKNPKAIIKFHIDPLVGLLSFQVRDALYQAGVESALMRPMSEFFQKLYQAFTHYKANLVEINPLALVDEGTLIAVDSKFIIDEEDIPSELSGWENEELADNPQEQMAKKEDLQYVKLGDVDAGLGRAQRGQAREFFGYRRRGERRPNEKSPLNCALRLSGPRALYQYLWRDHALR